MLDPADRTWGPALGEENKEASIVTIHYFLLSPNGKGHKSLSSSHSCSRQGNNREGVLRGQKLEWKTLASRSTQWLILKVNTIAWGDSNDQLRKWHSSHPNQMRPPRLGSQLETLSAEQPNLQQSWNKVSKGPWEELNLSRLPEVLEGMNFREKSTNEDLFACQGERLEKYPWLMIHNSQRGKSH